MNHKMIKFHALNILSEQNQLLIVISCLQVNYIIALLNVLLIKAWREADYFCCKWWHRNIFPRARMWTMITSALTIEAFHVYLSRVIIF